jgi:hypothetical protein
MCILQMLLGLIHRKLIEPPDLSCYLQVWVRGLPSLLLDALYYIFLIGKQWIKSLLFTLRAGVQHFGGCTFNGLARRIQQRSLKDNTDMIAQLIINVLFRLVSIRDRPPTISSSYIYFIEIQCNCALSSRNDTPEPSCCQFSFIIEEAIIKCRWHSVIWESSHSLPGLLI